MHRFLFSRLQTILKHRTYINTATKFSNKGHSITQYSKYPLLAARQSITIPVYSEIHCLCPRDVRTSVTSASCSQPHQCNIIAILNMVTTRASARRQNAETQIRTNAKPQGTKLKADSAATSERVKVCSLKSSKRRHMLTPFLRSQRRLLS